MNRMSEKNYKVSEIDVLEYLKKFSTLRTALSDFYIKSGNCRILGITDADSTGIGFLIEGTGGVNEILFIAAENEDVKRSMLGHLIKKTRPGSQIGWRIIGNAENERLAAEYGFTCNAKLDIFRTIGFYDELSSGFYKKNRKMYEFMEKRGYRTVCFDELTEDELMQIKNNPDNEFDSYLHPESMMNGGAGAADGKLSFASVKDGKVAAYNIARNPGGKQCIFEIVCVAESKRNSGVFILPVTRSFEAMRTCGAESVLFAVYESNQKMLEILRKQYSAYFSLQSVQHNYIYYKNAVR